jgi:CheY-like chemotaxis protein
MGSPPQPHGHTVLLVEDDAGTRDAMSAWLMAHEYTVVAALDCLDALTLVQGEPRPCIIVLDLMMSGMSGDDFRRAQLADLTVRDIPVILVSGVRDLAERAQALGVAAYLRKPIDTEQLVTAIARYCVAAIAVA